MWASVDWKTAGGGVRNPKIVYQEWPKSIFPSVNFTFLPTIWVSRGPGRGAVAPSMVVSMGGAQVQPPTLSPFKHFGPLKGGGVGGGSRDGDPGTPTYIPQNDALIAMIILNTRMWGFLK